MSQYKRPRNSPPLRDLGRRRRQTGELSMIEAARTLHDRGSCGNGRCCAARALRRTPGGKFVQDRIHASQFKSEAQLFHTGILDATANDTDFASETLQTLVQNHAFDAAGARVAPGGNSLKGMFGGWT